MLLISVQEKDKLGLYHTELNWKKVFALDFYIKTWTGDESFFHALLMIYT